MTTGIQVERSVYNVRGRYAFQANMHEPGKWHGFPIPWTRLPSAAAEALIAAGRLSSKDYRAALRKGLGAEYAHD